MPFKAFEANHKPPVLSIKQGLTEGERTTRERTSLLGLRKKLRTPRRGKALLRQTTKAETNYLRNFVDEIKALSIFGEEKERRACLLRT
jgi:hypothetical protein